VAEKKEVLELLRDHSQKQAERELAVLYPENISIHEKERVVSEELTQITFTADQPLMEKLEKLKNLLSHQNSNPSYQELFHLMADQLLKKLDPAKQQSRSVTPVAEKQRDTDSRYVPNFLKREVWKLGGGQCTYVNARTGRRCTSRHLLQIDHIQPFALGGRTELSNLRLLCR
jgi:hypothetical protein